MKLNLLYTYIIVAASCLFIDGQGRLLKASTKDLKTSIISSKVSLDCDVTTFGELQDITDVDGDIKICSGTIVFIEQIDLSGKQMTFTCPKGGCVLDAELKSRFFYIAGGSNISFDGITFKNGNSGFGGAISIGTDGKVDIVACSFVGNTANVSGGAIDNDGVITVTGSKFDGNTAVTNGNNIFNFAGDGVVICNDKNTFKSSGGGRDDDSDGNYPPDLCAA